jgi:hypothetical protein
VSPRAHLDPCWGGSRALAREPLVLLSGAQGPPSEQVPNHPVDPSSQLLPASLALDHPQVLHFL